MKQVQYSGEWTFPVDKSFILNPDINIEAKAVYLALKSFCAPGLSVAFPSIDTLESCLKLSRGRLYKYLRELNALGLLVREQSSDTKGKFSHTLYTLFSTQKPVGGKPAHGLPHAKRYQGREEGPGKETTKERRAEAERIWAAYPACRRVGKQKTIGYILRAFERGFSAKFLLERTVMFATARAGEEKRYTPMSTTWFNQERFNDDPSTWSNGKPEPHNEGDPAGEVQGRPVYWAKLGKTWIKQSRE